MQDTEATLGIKTDNDLFIYVVEECGENLSRELPIFRKTV